MLHHFSNRIAIATTAAAACLCAATNASADDDLFGVTITDGTNTVTVTSNSLFDLADDVINTQAQFADFDGTDFTASLDYANLEDAIIVSGSATDESVRVQIPSIGFDQTFDDPDEAEDFLREDGASTVAAFIQEVNETTLIGVTDGNPTALTALMADETYRLFGQPRNVFAPYAQGNDKGRLFVQAGSISTDVGDGFILEAALSTGFKITDNVGLTFSFPGSFREIEDSQTFTIGSIVGLPIKLTPETNDDQPLLLQVTPFGQVAGGGSQDQLAGGLVIGGGGVALAGIKLGSFFLSTGHEFSAFGGQPIEAADFRFETDVSQTIYKGGVDLTYGGIGDESGYLQGGITFTQFLNDAAVDNYFSPYAGLGIKLGGASSLRIGYRGDFGDGFDVNRGEIALRLAH